MNKEAIANIKDKLKIYIKDQRVLDLLFKIENNIEHFVGKMFVNSMGFREITIFILYLEISYLSAIKNKQIKENISRKVFFEAMASNSELTDKVKNIIDAEWCKYDQSLMTVMSSEENAAMVVAVLLSKMISLLLS